MSEQDPNVSSKLDAIEKKIIELEKANTEMLRFISAFVEKAKGMYSELPTLEKPEDAQKSLLKLQEVEEKIEMQIAAVETPKEEAAPQTPVEALNQVEPIIQQQSMEAENVEKTQESSAPAEQPSQTAPQNAEAAEPTAQGGSPAA